MSCPPSWKAGVIPGRSREVQAGQCWEGYGADFPGSHFQAYKGEDGNSEKPLWLFQMQMTSGQRYCLVWWDDCLHGWGENSECFLLCLYQGLLQDLLFIPIEKKKVRYELDKWIIQHIENWLYCKAQRFVISGTKYKWSPIATNGITPGNRTGLGSAKQFCRKDRGVNKARHT